MAASDGQSDWQLGNVKCVGLMAVDDPKPQDDEVQNATQIAKC